jgi:23S rRNA (cytidine1920-2'-O)/16S rRNA (cytidine1409-2'-O)-methyltransferase
MTRSSSPRVRLDFLLVDRGIADSRQKAQAIILAGQVLVNEQKIEKPGVRVESDSSLRLLGEPLKYVSRGGLKLEGALERFRPAVAGAVCLDVGASTGGFTDCLLQRGAAKVYAVDAGTNQLDWKLREDARVVVMEKTNARYLTPGQIRERVDLITVDVAFISAALILPALPPLLRAGGGILVLVKPQFEVGPEQVGKGGIVRDPLLHRQAVEKVRSKMEELGFDEIECAESVLPGAEGNREFFLHARSRKNV